MNTDVIILAAILFCVGVFVATVVAVMAGAL